MRRPLTAMAVVLVVLCLLFGIADRVAAHYAEQQIAERVSTRLTSSNITSAPPDVTVTGYPFLTQVARGNYDAITLELHDLRGGTLPLPLLRVTAADVRAPLSGLLDGSTKAIATKVDGVGTVSYASLIELSGLTGLTITGDGKALKIGGNIPGVGQVRGSATVTVVNGSVMVRVTELVGVSNAALPDQYRQKLAVTFRLPQLPFQMKLTGVTPAAGGMEITVTAQEVELG